MPPRSRSGAAEKLKELLEARRRTVCVPVPTHRPPNRRSRVPQAEPTSPARYAPGGRLVALRPARQDDVRAPGDQSGKKSRLLLQATLGASATRCWSCSIWARPVWAVEGRLMKSDTGEITLRVAVHAALQGAAPRCAGKRTRGGVKTRRVTDPAARSRQRYGRSRGASEVPGSVPVRTRILRGIRHFLDAKGYL